MRLKLGDLLGRKVGIEREEPIQARGSGRVPVLADYSEFRLKLRGHHKGKTVWAHVRKTGLIWFDGRHFTSPSLAAAHAVGRATCNGWTFWEYQRAPGDWVPLDTLRK
jgi:hypothetical protein